MKKYTAPLIALICAACGFALLAADIPQPPEPAGDGQVLGPLQYEDHTFTYHSDMRAPGMAGGEPFTLEGGSSGGIALVREDPIKGKLPLFQVEVEGYTRRLLAVTMTISDVRAVSCVAYAPQEVFAVGTGVVLTADLFGAAQLELDTVHGYIPSDCEYEWGTEVGVWEVLGTIADEQKTKLTITEDLEPFIATHEGETAKVDGIVQTWMRMTGAGTLKGLGDEPAGGSGTIIYTWAWAIPGAAPGPRK